MNGPAGSVPPRTDVGCIANPLSLEVQFPSQPVGCGQGQGVCLGRINLPLQRQHLDHRHIRHRHHR